MKVKVKTVLKGLERAKNGLVMDNVKEWDGEEKVVIVM